MKKILFLADHWSTLDHDRDSTLHLARVARDAFSLECHWAHPEDIFVRDSEPGVVIDGTLVSGADVESLSQPRKRREARLSEYHSIHWRHDPPVGLATLRLWSLLSNFDLPLFNAPAALLQWNEKFSAMRYGAWGIPSHIVSGVDPFGKTKIPKSLKEDVSKGRWLLKPAAEAASRGVERLSPQSSKQLENKVTQTGPWIVLQREDQRIFTLGETRLFILNGKIAGCLTKRPTDKNSAILNFDSSLERRPKIEKSSPTAIQKTRGQAIAKDLLSDGIVLATVDFIGEKLLEINVTSPGMLRWMDEGLPLKKQLAYQYWKMITGK